MWSSSTCDCECDKKCKIDKYLDTKDCSYKKRLPVKLVLEYEDEILNILKPYLTIKQQHIKISNLFTIFHW